MSSIEEYIRERLFAMQDKEYAAFLIKLIPTVAPETVIGVRTPGIKKLAKVILKMPQAEDFVKNLPHKYYEENNLHGFYINNLKDYEKTVSALDAFLPFVDNWATCDSIRPKVFKNHLPKLLIEIKRWIASGDTYTVRFGIEMLMNFYLDEQFETRFADMVADIHSDEYYVNMMKAWYFATALAKQYDAVISYIENRRLDKWTHNKAIQKAVESYRITDEQKVYLKTLKMK